MSKDITLDMIEVEQVGALLLKLPKGLGFKTLISGLRSASRPMIKDMKSRASFSKRVQRSIGVKASRKQPAVWLGIHRHLLKRTGAYWWRFYEFGTTIRKPRKAKFLRFWSVQLQALISVRQTAAIKERPFLRPAIDSKLKVVEKGVILNVRKALLRFLKRHKKR